MLGGRVLSGSTECRAARRCADSVNETAEMEQWMTRHDRRRLRWLREAEREMQPFHARSWFSARVPKKLLVPLLCL